MKADRALATSNSLFYASLVVLCGTALGFSALTIALGLTAAGCWFGYWGAR